MQNNSNQDENINYVGLDVILCKFKSWFDKENKSLLIYTSSMDSFIAGYKAAEENFMAKAKAKKVVKKPTKKK
jgi:hypothetical protein